MAARNHPKTHETLHHIAVVNPNKPPSTSENRLPLSTLPKPGSETRVLDFQSYLSSISEPYARFYDVQQHARSESLEDQEEQNALVACLKEVPALYFKEDFKLVDGSTFKAACPFRTISENLVMQEKQSQYLDVVELHLGKGDFLAIKFLFGGTRCKHGFTMEAIDPIFIIIFFI